MRIRFLSRARHHRQGFSLVELSIVVAILSVVATLGLETAASFANRNALSVTQDSLTTLDDAMQQFVTVYGRLPCPNDRTLGPRNTSYGLENCGMGLISGTGGLPGGGVMVGAIPFRTLNLPMAASLDGFGTKFNYAVTKNLTTAGTANGQFGSTTGASTQQGLGSIQIRTGQLANNCTGSDPCQILADPASTTYTPGAAYVIFSNGPDRRGGFSRNGVALIPCTPNTTFGLRIDTQNCMYTSTGALDGTVNAIPSNVFYDSRFNNGSVAKFYDDDLLVWHAKGQL